MILEVRGVDYECLDPRYRDTEAALRRWASVFVAAPKLAPVAIPSPDRRQFLGQAAIALSATPFVAAGYGLLYGRLDMEVTRQRIRLARLPKAFEGLRIAQLSDIHISPFMPADEIRRCVAITNTLKTDLVLMTGDYLLWDPAAQGEVVQALSGLRAPYGVFGCLGNHETKNPSPGCSLRRASTSYVRTECPSDSAAIHSTREVLGGW